MTDFNFRPGAVRRVARFALAIAAAVAAAQSLPAAGVASEPYAGMETRAIKALSAQELDDLGAGRGMGFALAAELNGYPGPRHVLDLADRLALSAAQREATESLFREMQAGAIELGRRLIADERALDFAFADRTVTAATLADLTAAIGRAQAGLRAHHLAYHLRMSELLSPAQTAAYNTLRGYTAQTPGAEPAHGGHGHHR